MVLSFVIVEQCRVAFLGNNWYFMVHQHSFKDHFLCAICRCALCTSKLSGTVFLNIEWYVKIQWLALHMLCQKSYCEQWAVEGLMKISQVVFKRNVGSFISFFCIEQEFSIWHVTWTVRGNFARRTKRYHCFWPLFGCTLVWLPGCNMEVFTAFPSQTCVGGCWSWLQGGFEVK